MKMSDLGFYKKKIKTTEVIFSWAIHRVDWKMAGDGIDST